MIPKENIEEITSLFNQKRWMLYIPFLIYFGYSIFQIVEIKTDIGQIQNAVDKYAEDKFEPLNKRFDEYSFLANRKDKLINLHDNLKPSFSILGWKRIEEISNWENEMTKIIAFNNGLFQASTSKFDHPNPPIKLETKDINIGKQYPKLRKYFSLIIAESINNFFLFKTMNFECSFYCNYFNPVLQRFGNKYHLYPDQPSRFIMSTAEIKVNEKLVYDNKYRFRPKKKGVHFLEIDYTFWGQNGVQTVKSRKELLVK